VLSFRIKARCLELEMSNEEYQKRYEQLDEDRADIIAYLKRMVQEKEDEMTELKERLEGLHKVHDKAFQHNVPLFFYSTIFVMKRRILKLNEQEK
jgi:hypothetical protein